MIPLKTIFQPIFSSSNFKAKDFQVRRKRGKASSPTNLLEEEPPKRGRFDKVVNAKTASPLRTDVNHKVNKLIIQNDTEDEEEFRKEVANSIEVNRRKRRHVSPIKFDATPPKQEIRKSRDRISDISDKLKDEQSDENSNLELKSLADNPKIKTLNSSGSKYDNLPPCKCFILKQMFFQTQPTINLIDYIFSSVSSTVTAVENKIKSKDRCKYFPTCGKGERCEFFHPTTPCKTFPNCKFGDTCLYIHPKCKFDLTCSKMGCNFSHTPVFSAAPPLCKSFLIDFKYFIYFYFIHYSSKLMFNLYFFQHLKSFRCQIIKKSVQIHYQHYAVSIHIVRIHCASFIIQNHVNLVKIVQTKLNVIFIISICRPKTN